jgi:hypothetical protein
MVNVTVDTFQKKYFSGTVTTASNIGENLPNTDSKVFEELIRLRKADPFLRPSITTGKRIVINTFNDAIFVPMEFVHNEEDSISFVNTRKRTNQIVFPGDANDK